MNKKKINSIILIVFLVLLVTITGCGTQSTNIDNNKDTNIESTKNEDENLKSELFGDSEDKKNYYFNNEKTIRKFILSYNEFAKTKVNKVEWKNNHQIAYVYFNEMSAKFNTGGNVGFLIEFEFTNGKEMLNTYKEIIQDLILTFDSSIPKETFNESFNNAELNQYKPTMLTDNISITMHYSEEQVGYKSGDRYYIDITCSNYNK